MMVSEYEQKYTKRILCRTNQSVYNYWVYVDCLQYVNAKSQASWSALTRHLDQHDTFATTLSRDPETLDTLNETFSMQPKVGWQNNPWPPPHRHSVNAVVVQRVFPHPLRRYPANYLSTEFRLSLYWPSSEWASSGCNDEEGTASVIAQHLHNTIHRSHHLLNCWGSMNFIGGWATLSA